MSKLVRAAAIALSALAVPLFAATPASAASLPDGDTLYGLSCVPLPAVLAPPPTFSTLYQLDGDTAGATVVDAPTTGIDDDCAGPAAYDPTTKRSYYISRTAPATLALIDAATGSASPIAGFSGGNSNPTSMAIGVDGKAYAIWANVLYSLDLDSAVLTTIGTTMSDSCLFGFSVDPRTGLFYAIQCDTGTVYEVDVIDAGLTKIGQFVDVDPDSDGNADIMALQIDTSGRWWIEVYDLGDNGEPLSMLFSSPIPSGVPTTTPSFEGYIQEASGLRPQVDSLLITYPDAPPPPVPPAPPLPATGPAASAAVLVGAIGLLAIGGIAVVVVRRRAAAEARQHPESS